MRGSINFEIKDCRCTILLFCGIIYNSVGDMMNEVDLKLNDLFADLNPDKKPLDDKTVEDEPIIIDPKVDKILTNTDDKSQNPEKYSKDFGIALKRVIERDLKQLSNKVNCIIEELTKRLLKSGVSIIISNDINDMEDIINDVESALSSLISQKHEIKVYLFSPHKKEKREKIKFFEEQISYATNVQSNLISIKNEVESLNQKKKELMQSTTSYDLEESNEVEEDFNDMLERTINFYMNRGKDL